MSSSRSSSGVSRSEEKVVDERVGRPWPIARIAYAWRSSWRPFSGGRIVRGFVKGYRDLSRGLTSVVRSRGLAVSEDTSLDNPFVPSPTGRKLSGWLEGEKKSPTQLSVTVVRREQRRNTVRSYGSGGANRSRPVEPVRAACGRCFCGSSGGPSSETSQSSRRSAPRFALTRGVPRSSPIVGVKNPRIKQQDW